MFYLSRTGTTEGPFTEAVIVNMIRTRLAEKGHVCAVGAQEWLPLASHPPFAQALDELRAREPAAPAASVAPAPATAAPQDAAATAADEAATVLVPPRSVAPAMMQPVTPSVAPPALPQPTPTPYDARSSMPPQTPSWAPPPQQSFTPQPPLGAQPPFGSQPPSYGPGPSHPGAPPYAAHPSGFAGAMSIPPKKESKVGIIVGAVLGVLLLLGGGGAALAWWFLFKSAPLANHYSDATQVYVEVGNVKRAALGLATVHVVDASKIDERKAVRDVEDAFAAAFDLSKDDAARVGRGIQGLAFGGRDLDSANGDTFAAMIAWDDTRSAETLLKSRRFTEQGDVGKTGKRYSLERRTLAGDQKKNASLLENVLSDLRVAPASKRDQLVWFPKRKLLVIGNERGIEDTLAVIEGSQKALADAPTFKTSKATFHGSGLDGFVDPAVVKGDKLKDVQKYLAGTRPIVLSVTPERAGVRMTISGEIAVDEDLDKLGGWLDSPPLAIQKKLPKETVAYFAFSSKTKLSGKEARDLFFKGLTKEQSTAGLQKDVEEGEKALGADLTSLFDALGDEGTIAAVARSGYRYQKDSKPSFDDFGVVYAQKLKDQNAAKKIVGALKEKVGKGGPFKLTQSGDDVVVDAEKPFPHVEIRFIDGHLVAVAGAKEIAERTFAAIRGTSTLSDDSAHTAALASLEAKHALMWIDAGRIGDNALTAMPELKDTAKQIGLDIGALVLTGDKRISSAVGLTFAKSGTKLGYTIDSMNLPVVAGALGAAAPAMLFSKRHGGSEDLVLAKRDALDADKADKSDRGSRLVAADKGDTANAKDNSFAKGNAKGASSAPSAGGELPELCEATLSRYERCVYKSLPASSRANVVRALRGGMVRQTGETRMRYCQQLADAAERSAPGCR